MDLQKLLAVKKISEDQTSVSMALAKKVFTIDGEEQNVVLSPLSIHFILGVVADGSTGQAQKEVLDYLKYNSSGEYNWWLSQIVMTLFDDASSIGGPHLSCATAVWVDKRFTLKPRFKEIIDNAYKTVIDQVDFQNRDQVGKAVEKVNRWAKEETNGLINEVLSPSSVDALTRLLLGNAVYFKGAWVNEFCPYYTRDREFFLSNGKSVNAPFMTMDGKCRKHNARAFDGFKVLGLPYKQGRDQRCFSMYIFLPDSIDGLPALVEKVTSTPGFIQHHLPYERVELREFCIPKFKICFQFQAHKILKELGLVSPFSGGLTEMVDENLNVSNISQKSFIEVNERGTEASAFTVCLTGGGGPSPDIMSFVPDHPFLFIIREDTTGMLLFVGQVLNPLLN